MTDHRVCNQTNTTIVTSGAGTAYPSGAPEFTSGFQWGLCYSIFSFMCMFCRSLFVLFLLATVLSVLLRFRDSDQSFGIFIHNRFYTAQILDVQNLTQTFNKENVEKNYCYCDIHEQTCSMQPYFWGKSRQRLNQCRGPHKDRFYKALFQLAEQFQMRNILSFERLVIGIISLRLDFRRIFCSVGWRFLDIILGG